MHARDLMALLPNPALIHDRGRIVWANPAMETRLGDCVGRTMADYVASPDELAEVLEELRQQPDAVLHGRTLFLRDRDGRVHVSTYSSLPYEDDTYHGRLVVVQRHLPTELLVEGGVYVRWFTDCYLLEGQRARELLQHVSQGDDWDLDAFGAYMGPIVDLTELPPSEAAALQQRLLPDRPGGSDINARR